MTSDLDAILADLPRLLDQCRWAYTHGLWKAGRGLDAERGAPLVAPKDAEEAAQRLADPDYVKAATYELDIGDHAARVAYEAAAEALRKTDRIVAVLVLAGGTTEQPPLLPLDGYSPPDRLERVVQHVTTRAGWVRNPTHPSLRKARALVDKAVRGLSKALDAGPAEGIAHGEMCVSCTIRPRSEHVAVDGTVTERRRGECETCARYRARTGVQRPRRLDDDFIGQAKAAQARRVARGESWGAA